MNGPSDFFSVVFAGRTWRAGTYLLLGLPLGVLWGVYAITMYAVSFALVIVWVGVPLFLVTHLSMRGISAFERGTANGMLGAQVVAPRRARDAVMGTDAQGWEKLRRWALRVLKDGVAWRAFAWTAIRLVTGPVGFAVALVAFLVPFVLVVAFVAALVFDVSSDASWVRLYVAGGDVVGNWTWVGYASGFAVLVVAPTLAWLVRGFAALHAMLARWALGPGEESRVEAERARANIAEEQVRIDQELHDSIGHMITMNIVQAGAGAHVFDTDPEFARQALRNIEERGRAAMGELDRIIAAIRGDEPETRRPLPGIADIGALVDQFTAAGMVVTATLEPPSTPAAVGRATFSIVREALTNAAKHAPGAAVELTVVRDGDAVAIAVSNSAADAGAPDPGALSTGRGLGGIRDRATLLGGRTHIGPVDGGGFEVLALLPVEAALAAQGDEPSRWSGLREKVSA